tara:strand:- start:295 stop:609 length:315 start_codon:yes stop_codon:yes gene_type:complete
MKNLILIVGLVAASFSFNANAADSATCWKISELAQALMKVRQEGNVSLNKILTLSQNDPTGMTKPLAEIAWKVEAHKSEKQQQEAITKFRNDMHLFCLDKINGA